MTCSVQFGRIVADENLQSFQMTIRYWVLFLPLRLCQSYICSVNTFKNSDSSLACLQTFVCYSGCHLLVLYFHRWLVPKFPSPSPCNLLCYLQVVLYKLKPRARFHSRFTSMQDLWVKKPSSVNGLPLPELVDSTTLLLRASALLCVSANQSAHQVEILSNMIIWLKEKIPHCWSRPLWKYDNFFKRLFGIADQLLTRHSVRLINERQSLQHS